MMYKIASVFGLSLALVARAAEFQVTVGGPGVLRYNPQFVNASPGDIVTFSFEQKNHTVTQSTFEDPCQQADGGFDSGFVPVPDNNTAGPFPAAQFTVQDTNPVWVFCRQTGHCQQGMVFAINPGDNFAAFQANAMGNATTNSSTSSGSAATASPSVVTVTATVTVPASSASASSAASAPPASSTSSDHVVIVGGPNKLFYDPANITAQPGDTVTFRFMQTNHTATQSSFAAPCEPLSESSTSGQVGFDSGFMPVGANATTFPEYVIQVNDTAPIWTFCRQTSPKSHCGAGMVFSVNAVADSANNFAAFQANAVQLNGTGSASGTASATNGVRGHSAGIAGALLGLATGLLLF